MSMPQIFGTLVINGRKYPSCRYCEFKLSSFYAGTKPDDKVLEATIDRYVDHVFAKHPEKARELYDDVKLRRRR